MVRGKLAGHEIEDLVVDKAGYMESCKFATDEGREAFWRYLSSKGKARTIGVGESIVV